MKIHQADWKFVKSEPDPDFNEERNRRIIEDSIAETERIQAKKREEFGEQLKERADAVARFIQSVKSGANSSDIQGYFGKKMLEHLSGLNQRKLDDLTVIDQYGRVIRKKGDAKSNVS